MVMIIYYAVPYPYTSQSPQGLLAVITYLCCHDYNQRIMAAIDLSQFYELAE